MNPPQSEATFPTLLASIVGISRKEVEVNLASTLFSKPEVESMHNPLETKRSFKDSKSILDNDNTHAVLIIQK
jgi:hypothetical protein